MKLKLLAISGLVIVLFLLSACGASEAQIATAIAQTEAAKPSNTPTSLPTSTNTPEPTSTPEPSPTPVVLPDVLEQTFSGISIRHQDNFEFVLDGMLPEGWACDEPYAARITKDNQFKIQPKDDGEWSGTVFYYEKEKLTPGTGIYFTFMYAGDKSSFSLGLDTVDKDGQRIKYKEKGFYSVAMQMDGKALSAHIIEYTFTGTGYFKGDLKLEENRWYNYALGFDGDENYIIKIWDVENPELQLTYIRNWKDFPTDYIFISWVSGKRSLVLDDFMFFSFDTMNLE